MTFTFCCRFLLYISFFETDNGVRDIALFRDEEYNLALQTTHPFCSVSCFLSRESWKSSRIKDDCYHYISGGSFNVKSVREFFKNPLRYAKTVPAKMSGNFHILKANEMKKEGDNGREKGGNTSINVYSLVSSLKYAFFE